MARLLSAAGTGYFYTIRKPRLRERMTLRKYDPVGKDHVFALNLSHDSFFTCTFILLADIYNNGRVIYQILSNPGKQVWSEWPW